MIFALMCGCAPTRGGDEYSETRLLMDTVCTINAGGGNARAAVAAAFSRIEEIDAAVSYFSDSSEVSAINRAGAGESVAVGEDTFKIIKTALEVSERTGGAFDMTTAPLKDLWRFADGAHEPPSQEDIDAVLPLVDYSRLTLDDNTMSVVKSEDGVKIDLGGAAKGYAADCAAETLRQNGAAYALLDLGGNVYAFGKNPDRRSGDWLVGIQKPFSDSGEYSQTVTLGEGAVVTSGNYQRYFEWDGKLYHHILDPRSGSPADSGILSASIVSESALLADCLSTACMVLGEADGRAAAESFGVRLITEK